MRPRVGKLPDSEVLLSRFYRATLSFLVPMTAEETYPVVGKAAMRLMDAQSASIFITKAKKLERVWDSSAKMFRVSADKNQFAARAVSHRTPTVVSYSKLAPLHPQIVDWGVRSVTFIPLFYRKNKLGYIALDSFADVELSGKEKNVLKIFGSMAMLAIRKAQLHDEIQDSLKTRDLFISLASHELRSPLTTINSYSQMIDRTLAKKHRIDRSWVKVLRAETKRLIMMINELLQVDQIKSGELQYGWNAEDLQKILARAVISFRVRYPKRKLIYRNSIVGKKAVVMADFDKILQAVLNILLNAAKFSPEKSKIYLTLVYEAPNYKISVKDEGPGIAKADKRKIFESFYKGSSSNQSGMGLGLYLTKNIINMHGGKIKVDSKEGQGTTFNIYFPKL